MLLYIDDSEGDTLRLALEKLRDDRNYSPIVGYKCNDLIRKISVAREVVNQGCLSPKCEAGYETCSVCKSRKSGE